MPFDEATKNELEDVLASMGTDAFDLDANQRLEVLLGESDEARRIYLEHCQMHAMLHQSTLLSAFHAEKRQGVHVQSRRMRRSFARWMGLAVALSAVFIIGLAAAKFFRDDPGKVDSAPEPGIAYVARIEGSAWLDESELLQGANVSSGTIRVGVGAISLRFGNGTTLLMEGPTELSIDNDMQISLRHGRVAARVSEDAYGFTVLGPDSAVVDLGTEFAMVVQDGKSWVEVYDGEVDVALLNEDGHAWKSRQLTVSGPVRIDAPNGRIVDEVPVVAMPRFSEFSLEGLEVPTAYVAAVLKGKPDHYWRFEGSSDGQVADIAGDAVATLEGGARIHNRSLYLPPGIADLPRGQREHGFVSVSEPSSSLANGEFTLEAWVKPAFFQRRSLIDIRHRDPRSPSQTVLYSLNLLSSQQQAVYPRETFRFTARLWPYSESGEVSTFSAAPYHPDSWQHVVAVRHDDRIELYLNGKPARAVPVPPIPSDSLPTTISIGNGQRFPGRVANRGFFKGLVDEVAVYPSAMSAEQVAEHYRLMQVR
jgi:ferric-dicitrate binding protein FerR (iron transport regulator)